MLQEGININQNNKVPPGQIITSKFPVIHVGTIPQCDLMTWDFKIFGLVEDEKKLSWSNILELPQYSTMADAHCVTTWSRLQNNWEGVAFHTIMSLVKVLPEANYALIHAENGYSVNLSLDDLMREGVMLAYKHNGNSLSPEHGFPVRLIVPHLYFWKSAKWVRGVEFLSENTPGFWESRGYNLNGNPWLEERYAENKY